MFGKNTIIPTILLDASFPVPLRMESFSKKRSMTVWDDSSIPFIPEVMDNDNHLWYESFSEYDEHLLLDCSTTYDAEGNMDDWNYFRYDEYHNLIESIWFSLNDNCRPEIRAKYTYKYEYYE